MSIVTKCLCLLFNFAIYLGVCRWCGCYNRKALFCDVFKMAMILSVFSNVRVKISNKKNNIYFKMFVTGKDENATDCLKSIMAIYLFRQEIKSQAEKGIDFRNSLVVPEVDADTQEKLHQREDHNHSLKRIVGCLREGLIPGLQVKFLRDALHDPG